MKITSILTKLKKTETLSVKSRRKMCESKTFSNRMNQATNFAQHDPIKLSDWIHLGTNLLRSKVLLRKTTTETNFSIDRAPFWIRT